MIREEHVMSKLSKTKKKGKRRSKHRERPETELSNRRAPLSIAVPHTALPNLIAFLDALYKAHGLRGELRIITCKSRGEALRRVAEDIRAAESASRKTNRLQ